MKGDNPQDLAQRRKQLKRIDQWLDAFLKTTQPHPFNIVGANCGTNKRQRREDMEALCDGV